MGTQKRSEEEIRGLEEAKDTQTNSTRLEQLFVQYAPQYRELALAVMRNPNTPASILSQNLTTYADAFCENPVAPLLLLEMPGLLEGRHDRALKRLLRRPSLPEVFVIYLTGHKNRHIAEMARLHVAHLGEMGENWRADLTPILAKRMPKKSESINRLRAYDLVPEWLAKAMCLPVVDAFTKLKEPFVHPDLAWYWQEWEKSQQFVLVEDHPVTDEERDVVDNQKWDILKEWLDNNRVTPSFIRYITYLYYTKEGDVRTFIEEDTYFIFRMISKNPNTPEEILKTLSRRYQGWIIDNPSIPITILENILGQISAKSGTYFFASYHCLFYSEISLHILTEFLEEKGSSLFLLNRADCPEEKRGQILLHHEATSGTIPTRFIALLQIADQEILQRYYRSHEWLERLAIALNPHAETKWLEYLEEDGNAYIRAAAKAARAADTYVSHLTHFCFDTMMPS
jgi:hypothetical protein